MTTGTSAGAHFWISVFEHGKTCIIVTLSSGSGIGKAPTMQWGPLNVENTKIWFGLFWTGFHCDRRHYCGLLLLDVEVIAHNYRAPLSRCVLTRVDVYFQHLLQL